MYVRARITSKVDVTCLNFFLREFNAVSWRSGGYFFWALQRGGRGYTSMK
ncbi:unnamed protein product [Ectocarpus sp. CCAP 1310/34]|nr:unnamed protein product [Ectocarpus sp. CCAP 1310/34]